VGAERFKRYALDELLDHELYARLAARERNERNRKLLEELARDELRHHLFWSKLAGPVRLGLGDRLRLRLLLSLSRLAGKTFTIKLLERGEAATVGEYRRAAAELGGELAAELARVIEDEERHESELAGSLDELAVRQLGSIALGVSDAIIELTGVLAGFAGYTGSPLQVAAAGLIVGVSAALSMAAAAYSQAKHERGKNPRTTATFTGLFYMLTVLALVAPLLLGVPASHRRRALAGLRPSHPGGLLLLQRGDHGEALPPRVPRERRGHNGGVARRLRLRADREGADRGNALKGGGAARLLWPARRALGLWWRSPR